MAIIERKRKLSPSTREPGSSYKVNTEKVGMYDMLRLTICHKDKSETPLGIFEFRGSDVSGKKSIHFSTEKSGEVWKIKFIGVKPFSVQI
jgi:hypothetical protein